MAVNTFLPRNLERQTGIDWLPRPRILRSARSIRVREISRPVEVGIASRRWEWEQAFALVADRYQSRGYDQAGGGSYHFTAHHALADTATIVAVTGGKVIATMSLVADNDLIGLPMEYLYGPEIRGLRQEGRRLVEVTSLAAVDLPLHDFTHVFREMSRFVIQYHLRQGGDTWVITVNPRHRGYYTRLLGYVPLGPQKAYARVQGHPAEAYYMDGSFMKSRSPRMHRQLFQVPLPDEALVPAPLPTHLTRRFAEQSCRTQPRVVAEILRHQRENGSARRW